MHTNKLFSLFISLISFSILTLFITCSSGPVKDGRSDVDIADPFPEKLLKHNVFTVFRGENLLGYIFRDKTREVIGPKFWMGKELKPKGRGENRDIVFSKKQAALLSARLPGIGFKAGYKQSARFRVMLRGLKVFQLTDPVLISEYRDLKEVDKKHFIVSMLFVEEVIIQAQLESVKGLRPAGKKDSYHIFAGDFSYSTRHKGVVAAKNRFIGYALSLPTSADLARKAAGQKEIRRLGIFKLEDKTGVKEYNFLSETMREKLEEAFLRVPEFEVLNDRREDAKYHLKGKYRKIGSRIHITLTLQNTYNQKQLAKLVEGIRVKNADELYDYQIKVVNDFKRKLGIIRITKAKGSNKKVARKLLKIKFLIQFREATNFYNRGKYASAENILDNILAESPRYIRALKLQGYTLLRQSKFLKAKKVFKQLLILSKKRDDPIWQAEAMHALGVLYFQTGNYNNAGRHFRKALNIKLKIFGPGHEITANSYYELGRVFFNIARWQNKKAYYHTAEKYYNKYKDILMMRYGPENYRLLPAYSGLAHVHAAQDNNTRALELLVKTHKVSSIAQGKNHPETGTYHINLGQQYIKMNLFKQGMYHLKMGLEIHKKAFKGENHARVAFDYIEIGSAYYNQRKYDDAQNYFEKGASINKKIYGQNHVRTQNAYDWLATNAYAKAVTLFNMGKYKKASKFFLKSLSMYEKHFGMGHKKTRASYEDVASSFTAMGIKLVKKKNASDSESYLLKAADLYEKLHGNKHIKTKNVYRWLAHVYRMLNKKDKEEEYLKKAGK